MTVRHELFEMRLDALSQDITTVKEVINAAQKRGRQLEEIKARIGRSGNVLGPLMSVNMTVGAMVELLRRYPDLRAQVDRASTDLPLHLANCVTHLATANDGINQANETLDQIASTFVDLNDLDPNLEITLRDRCDEVQRKVDELRDDLATKPLRDVWRRYEALIDDDCHALFSEYVDFLGGLTLRDTALDDGVCSMTDRLLELYNLVAAQKSLAVPVHHGPIGNAMRSLIKLGFPEWTIWSVPLVGYDIGLGIAEKMSGQRKFREFITPARSEKSLRQLLADAFATYSLGLAYGCAAIILRLQPHHDDHNPDTATDVERVSLILQILRGLTQTGDPLDQSIDKLAEHWNEAVNHLQGTTAADAGVRDSAEPASEHKHKPVNSDSNDTPAWLNSFADNALNEFAKMEVDPLDASVRLISEMLRRLASPGDPVAESIESLVDQWSAAVEQFRSTKTMAADAFGGLDHIPDANSADSDWMEKLAVTAVAEFKRQGVAPYNGERFARATSRWADRLAEEPQAMMPTGDDADPSPDPLMAITKSEAATVLDLLNTAWKLRLEEPDVVGWVTQNVRLLWRGSEEPIAPADHFETTRQFAVAAGRRG